MCKQVCNLKCIEYLKKFSEMCDNGLFFNMQNHYVGYYILVRKPEGKRKLEKAKSRWEDKIRLDFKE
jgi:hypothetical protein